MKISLLILLSFFTITTFVSAHSYQRNIDVNVQDNDRAAVNGVRDDDVSVRVDSNDDGAFRQRDNDFDFNNYIGNPGSW